MLVSLDAAPVVGCRRAFILLIDTLDAFITPRRCFMALLSLIITVMLPLFATRLLYVDVC